MSQTRNVSSLQLEPRLPSSLTLKIVGQGGVGSIFARYACTFLASLCGKTDSDARVVLIDPDVFERKNSARMLFRQLGNKATVNRDELLEYLAASRIAIDAVTECVDSDSISRLLHDEDLIALCVDNHATRKLVSDYCGGEEGWPGLPNVCLISGGNQGVGADSTGRVRRGTFGNCQIYVRRDGMDVTPSLTEFHDEIKHPADQIPGEDCIEMMTSVPQILPANLMVASNMLNTLWLHLCDAIHYRETVFDIAEGLMRPLPLPSR